MHFSIMHDICSQVIFRVDGGDVYAGIRLPNGNVISAGDGDIYKETEVEILKIYETWIDLTDEIVGDWGL